MTDEDFMRAMHVVPTTFKGADLVLASRSEVERCIRLGQSDLDANTRAAAHRYFAECEDLKLENADLRKQLFAVDMVPFRIGSVLGFVFGAVIVGFAWWGAR